MNITDNKNKKLNKHTTLLFSNITPVYAYTYYAGN